MNPGNLTLQTRRLLRNFKWLSVQEFFIRLLGLATAIYLARVLSPSAYGSLGLALAIIGILDTLVAAGTGSRATRLTALHPADVPAIHAQTTGLRIVIAAVVLTGLGLCIPLITRTLSLPAGLLILCSLLLLRSALSVTWAFRGLDQMHVNALADITEKTLLFAGLVLLVKGQGNDLLWVPAIETVAALAVIWWLRKRLGGIYPGLTITFKTRDWPDISRESVPLGLAAFLGSVYLHGAILFLGWLDTAATAANFLVAQKLMLTMAILLNVINNSAFPSASRLLATDVAGALDLVSNLLRYYLVIIVPVIFLLARFADGILGLLFGDVYSGAAPVLIVLLAALPFLATNLSLRLLLRAIPKPKTVLAGSLVSTIVLLVTAAILIPRFGARGAAAAVFAGEAAGLVLLFGMAWLAIGVPPLNARSFTPVLAGAAAALIFVLTDQWSLPLALCFASLVYLFVLWTLKSVSAAELRSLPHVMAAALQNDKAEQNP